MFDPAFHNLEGIGIFENVWKYKRHALRHHTASFSWIVQKHFYLLKSFLIDKFFQFIPCLSASILPNQHPYNIYSIIHPIMFFPDFIL